MDETYISKKNVREIILNQPSRYDMLENIKSAPPADVRPNIHARWIPITDSYYEDGTVKESHWECSKCGSGKSGWGEFKFCPDCGAKMKGGE